MFNDIDKKLPTEIITLVLLHHSYQIQVGSNPLLLSHTCLDLFLVIPDLILP